MFASLSLFYDTIAVHTKTAALSRVFRGEEQPLVSLLIALTPRDFYRHLVDSTDLHQESSELLPR